MRFEGIEGTKTIMPCVCLLPTLRSIADDKSNHQLTAEPRAEDTHARLHDYKYTSSRANSSNKEILECLSDREAEIFI